MIQHFLLTRYNTGLYGRRLRVSYVEWMEHRLDLFRKYLVPSIKNQTFKDFKWLIFFDPGTPDDYMQRVFEVVTPVREVANVYLTTGGDLNSYADRAVKNLQESKWVATSRVDNDDALHKDFMERIAAQSVVHQLSNPEFHINFDWGYVYDVRTGELAVSCQGSNPFITRVSSGDPISIVWGYKHTEAASKASMKRISIPDEPYWIQIIHGKNVSNRMNGKRIEKGMEKVNLKILKREFGCVF